MKLIVVAGVLVITTPSGKPIGVCRRTQADDGELGGNSSERKNALLDEAPHNTTSTLKARL